jgi:hypothetical protein
VFAQLDVYEKSGDAASHQHYTQEHHNDHVTVPALEQKHKY